MLVGVERVLVALQQPPHLDQPQQLHEPDQPQHLDHPEVLAAAAPVVLRAGQVERAGEFPAHDALHVVQRDDRDEVDEEPPLEVPHGQLVLVRLQPEVLVDDRSAEVDEDVRDEVQVHEDVQRVPEPLAREREPDADGEQEADVDDEDHLDHVPAARRGTGGRQPPAPAGPASLAVPSARPAGAPVPPWPLAHRGKLRRGPAGRPRRGGDSHLAELAVGENDAPRGRDGLLQVAHVPLVQVCAPGPAPAVSSGGPRPLGPPSGIRRRRRRRGPRGPPGPGGGPGPERVRGPLRAAGDLRGRVERPAAEVDGRRTLCARPSPGPLPPQGRGAPPKGPGGGGAVGGALASPWRRREGAAAHRAGRPGGRAPCAARGAPPPCPTPPAGPCPTRAPPPPAPPAPASRPVKLTGRPPGAPSVCPGWTQVPAVCPLRRGGTGAGSGFPGLSGP